MKISSPAPRLLIVHGFTEYGARYLEMQSHMEELGIRVDVFDMCGHGSRREEFPAKGDWFEQFATDIGNQVGKLRGRAEPLFLYGHSMGGTAVLHYLREKGGNDLCGAVVCSPCCGPTGMVQVSGYPWLAALSSVAPQLPLPSRARASILTADRTKQDEYRKDPDILSKAPAGLIHAILATGRSLATWQPSPRLPLLIHQGEADRLCRPSALNRMLGAWPPNSFDYCSWPSGRHELHKELFRDEIFRKTADWIHAIARGIVTPLAPHSP